MKINFLRNQNIININKKGPSPSNLERIPNSDWVSFTRNSQNKNIDNSQAIDFGYQIYNLISDENTSLQVLEDGIKDSSNNISLKPMFNLTENDDFLVFSYPDINEKWEVEDKNIYLNLPEDNNDETTKMLLSMQIGREYSQIKQSESPKFCDAIKEISNGNYKYAQVIMGVSELLFKPFNNKYKLDVIENTYNIIDKANANKYGTTVPRKLEISEKTVLENLNANDKKEFEHIINYSFAHSFNNAVRNGLLKNEEIMKHVPKEKRGIEFYKDIRKYCAILAKKEALAHKTESKIAKKIMGTDNSLNIDILPIYYNMLSECLKKENIKSNK